MAAIITGSGLGLYDSSLNTLGQSLGQDPQVGRYGNQVYINAQTGNLVVRHRDEFLRSAGPDLGLVRTYNSQGLNDDANGDNWRLSVQQRIDFTGTPGAAGSSISKTNGDGSVTVFNYVTSLGYYTSSDGDGPHDIIRRVPATGNDWEWLSGTPGVREGYDASGRLQWLRDADGNERQFIYTGSLITRITDSSGQAVDLVYSGNNLSQITTSSNSVTQSRVSYLYDSSNRLERVTFDLSPEDNSITDGNTFVTTYGYDTAGRVNNISNSDGSSLSIVYNAAGRVQTVTDGESNTTTYTYNAQSTDVTNALGQVTTYHYDAQGRVSQIQSPALVASGQRLSTTYSYDADDNLTRIIDANGNASSFEYDSRGNLTRQRDGAGNVVEYSYTSNNLLQSKTVFLLPDPDLAADHSTDGVLQAAEPETEWFVYDSEHHLRFTVSAEGRVAEYDYTAGGLRSGERVYVQGLFAVGSTAPTESALEAWAAAQDQSQVQLTENQYDFRGQLSRSTNYSAMNANGTGQVGTESHSYFIYDQRGLLLKTVDSRGAAPVAGAHQANNYETAYVYDGLGRLLSATNALGHISSSVYDDANRSVTTTQANGLLQTSVYDRNGQVLSLSEYDPASLTTPLSSSRSVYDADGQVRATQDANGVITHVLYDEVGRAVAGIDGNGALSENILDANGQVVETITYSTTVSSTLLTQLVTLNPDGELTGIDSSITLAQLRPAAHADDRHNYNYYDEAGQLLFTIDAEGYVVEYRYDGAGELVDTISHSTPFPGFINNDAQAAQITVANDSSVLLEWLNNNSLQTDSRINSTIIEEETGSAITVDLNLANNTGTVSSTRVPNQIYESDNFASLDTRSVVSNSIVVGNTYSTDTVVPNEPYAINRSTAYSVSTENLSLSATNGTIYHSGVTVSGSDYTVPNVDYVTTLPSGTVITGTMFWDVRLYKQSGSSWNEVGNYQVDVRDAPPTPARFSNLSPGNYYTTIQDFYGVITQSTTPFPAPGTTGDPKYFTVGQTLGTVVNIPTAGATAVDFYYRDSSGNGGSYSWSQSDNTAPFSITLPASLNDSWLDYKIIYKSGGDVYKTASGTLHSSEANNTSSSYTAYQPQSASGTFIYGALSATEIGAIGDELSTTLKYVDARVYDATTGTLVSTARTYPNVVAAATGADGKLNLSIGTALADGIYRIELDKTYNDNSTQSVILDNSYQVGNVLNHVQEMAWPASVQAMQYGDTAVFSYRKTGDTVFTEIPLTPGTAGEQTYFIQDGNEYKVRLYGLDASQNYEYKVEYRAADKRLLKWTNVNTFNSSNTVNSNVSFLQHEDSSISSTGGTRLAGFLSPEDAQIVDYLSVRVINDSNSAVVHDNILTIPRVESNYLGALNLSHSTPLADGRYRIEVTRHFKDDNTATQTDSFIHEVGMQTISTQALTVTASGDQVSAVYNGALGIASGVTLDVNTATGSVSILTQQLNEGPYSYSQRINNTDNTYTEDTGRFAAYAGDAPTVSALRDYYNRTRPVMVDVTQGEHISYRSAELPAGYTYATSAENIITAQKASSITLSTTSSTVNSGNVLLGDRLDISHIGTPPTGGYPGVPLGETVWKLASVIDQSTGVVVYEEPAPSLAARNGTAPSEAGMLRQGDRPYFDIPNLPFGDYTLQVRTVVVTDIWASNPNYDGVVPMVGIFTIDGSSKREYYGWGETSNIDFQLGLPDTATISWSEATQPAGTTTDFQYRAVGSGTFREPLSLQPGGGNWTAGIGNDAPGMYEYIIEYRDASNEVVKHSNGVFEITLGGQASTENTMLEYVQVTDSVSGSAIISDELTAQGAAIQKVRAWVYDQTTNALVSVDGLGQPGPITTDVLPGNSLGAIKLREGVPLADGRYRITLEVTYTNSTIETRPDFVIEVGPQPVSQPATTLSWDATNRPANTDVYFRYKSVAEHEFDPQNMWIRATASQTIQGEYYVRFPQMTPDGQLLSSLPEGQYDYMVIYIDRETGKEIESTLGQFGVSYTHGGPDQTSSHQLSFTRDLEGRHGRIFYDADGRQTGSLDAMGYLTELRYNAAGQIVETIRYATQSNELFWEQGKLDQLRPASAAADLHEYIKYNSQGWPVLSIDAEGYVVETEYDSNGKVERVIAYANKTSAANIATAGIAAIRPTSSAQDRITVNSYTALNQLSSVAEQVGSVVVSVTEYEYNNVGALVRTTQALGTVDARTTSIRYDLQGRVIAELNGNGSQALNDLLVANPVATQSQIDAVWSQHAIRYDYDAAGQRIRVLDQNDNSTRFYYGVDGNIRYQVNAEGEIQETLYNTFGQVSHHIQYANRADVVQLAALVGGSLTPAIRSILNNLRDPVNDSVVEQDYDRRGLAIASRDALGYETRYSYNAFGELRFERHTISGGNNDGREHRVEHIYDVRGQKTNIISGRAGEDLHQGFDYDVFGRQVASYQYDSEQNLSQHYFNRYDRIGRVTETLEVVDAATANTLTVNGYSYDAFGRVLTQTDAAGAVTQYSYDDANRTLTVTTPEGISTTTKSNRLGETVEVTDGNGEVARFDYDRNGQLTQVTDAEGNSTSNQYDDAGRLRFTTDANGGVVEVRYDAANRVIERIVDPGGLALTTKTEYDAKGRIVKSTDAEGVITETHYDKKGQVVAVIVDPDDPASATQHLALATFYEYDSRGSRLTVSVGGQSGIIDSTDTAGNPVQSYQKALNTTQYEYDIHGRVIREIIDPNVTWVDSSGTGHDIAGLNIVTEYEYDAQGNVAAQTNARGYATRYVHDKFGRLIYSIAELADERGLVTKNNYDTVGRLVSVEQYAESVNLYQVASVLDMAAAEALLVGLNTTDNRIQQQVYDNDGRLVFTISPSGLVSENRYDANNGVIQTVRYSQSIASGSYATVAAVEAALLSANDSSPEQQAWSVYDGNGRALYNIDSLGYLTANDYDNNGNLVRSTAYAQAIDTAILNDASDNRTQIDALLPALNTNDANRTTRFSYDAADRLVFTIDAQGHVNETRYDDTGRVVASIDYAEQYTIAGAQPSVADVRAVLPLQPTTADRITQTAYDAAGRAIASMDAEGGVEHNVYDLAGNRVAFTNAKGHTWHYDYDAANRLIETRSPEVAVTRLAATLWQQDFAVDMTGLTASTDATGLNAAIVNDGRLELHTRDNATAVEPSVSSDRVYDFIERIAFQAEIATGASAINRHAFYGIKNAGSTVDGSYRQHGILFQGDSAYVHYYDGSWKTEALTTVKDNTAYVIDIATDEQGTTVYLYERGKTKADGVQHHLNKTDWNTVNAFASTRAAAGAAGSVVYINSMHELLPRDRALMNETAALSSQTVTESVVTRFEYNAMGDLTARIEAAGTVDQRRTVYAYDTLNRQVSVTHPQVGVYEYADASINYVSGRQETLQTLSTQSYFDAFGNEVLGIDTADNRSYKVYDNNNRLLYDIDANGYVTENRYDAFGNVVELVRYAQAITLPSGPVDALNPGLSPAAVAAQLNSSDSNNRVLKTDYDLLNRIIKTEQSAVSVVSSMTAQGTATISAVSPTTNNEYNAFGQLTKQSVLAEGNRWLDTYFYYDSKGQKIGSVDAEGYVSVWEYDSEGNTTRQVQYSKPINLQAPGLNLNDFSSVAAAIQTSTMAYRDASQLYVYVDTATQDTASSSSETANVQVDSVYDPNVTPPSASVRNYAWALSPDGTQLVQTQGLSLAEGSAVFQDNTPTEVKATIYRQDGTVYATVYTQVGATEERDITLFNDPIQPYVYAATASNDVATPVTETTNLAVNSVFDPRVTPQSGSVNNYAWTVNGAGTQLIQTDGISLAAGTATFNDTTPTEVKATIYRSDGSHYATVYTQVGSTENRDVIVYHNPVQPYTYQASATSDSSSWQTSNNVTVNVNNIQRYNTITQSANVRNYAWQYNYITQQLQTRTGLSLSAGSAVYNDPTVTRVSVDIYRTSDNQLVHQEILQPGHPEVTLTYPVHIKKWFMATNWNGEVNLVTSGSLPTGSYRAVITTRDDAVLHEVNNAQYGSDGDGTWSRTNTVYFDVGTQQIPDHIDTVITWPTSSRPADATSVEFLYRAGSSGSWSSKTVATSGSSYRVSYDHMASGSYSYKIRYKDQFGNIIKHADGSFNVSGGSNTNQTPTFNTKVVSSGSSGGSSITGYIGSTEANTIDYIRARVFIAGTSTQVGSDVLTYPEAHSSYNGRVNLKVGSPLSTGKYDVQITKNYKNGTPASTQTVYYEVGQQAESRPERYFWNGVSNWNGQVNLLTGTGSMPADTYRVDIAVRDDAGNYGSMNGVQLGSTSVPGADGDGTWTQSRTAYATVGTIDLPDIRYTDLEWSKNQQPAGTTVEFAYRAAGSSAAYTNATVDGATANYKVHINGLADGNYDYQITYRASNGDAVKTADGQFSVAGTSSSNQTATFNSETVTSASATGSSLSNYISTGEAASIHYVEAKVFLAGTSTQVGSTALTYPGAHASYNGSVNISVGAVLADGQYDIQLTKHYKEGTPAPSSETIYYEVGQQPDVRAEKYFWNSVNNWNGQVNLLTGTGSMPAGRYRIDIETRDLATAYTNINGHQLGSTAAPGADGDGTWSLSNTIHADIGTIDLPDTRYTDLTWARSLQPAGTVTEFRYRLVGAASYTSATVAANGLNHQVHLDQLADGQYEYQIRYLDSDGYPVKSTAGQFNVAGNGSAALSAQFDSVSVQSNAVTGSSIQGYITNVEAIDIDYIEAQVFLPGATTPIGEALRTYPRAHSLYNGEVVLSTGSVLENGSYDIRLTKHYRDGRPAVTETIPYEIGRQIDDNGGYGFDRETRYEYDRLNRLVTETNVGVLVSNAGTDNYSADFNQTITNLSTSYEYDAVGNTTAVTDVGGNIRYQFYDAMGRLTGETSVSRTQQQISINAHTTIFVDNSGTSEAALRWARPPVPGLLATLRVRAVGNAAWTTLPVVESGDQLTAAVAALPSDQYEYEISYSRVGQGGVYATATGNINIATASSVGSVNTVYEVADSGDTVIVSGPPVA